MKIASTKSKVITEKIISEVDNHSRLPTWYAQRRGYKCDHCGWDFERDSEVEAIKPKEGPLIIMHARCFMSAVNEGNNAETA